MAALFALIALLATSFPQAAPSADPLDQIRFLIGRWTGTGSGQPGESSAEREYAVVLGRYIHGRNTSTFAPQPRNPNGEVHQDWGFFSFDRVRKRIVLREFHVEGFVNQYVLEPSSGTGTFVFVSEEIENIAPGWRARETYRQLNDDEFEVVFELAAPGKDFELYSKSRLRRAAP